MLTLERAHKSEKGATLVEFSLAIGIFLIFTLAIIDIGRLVNQHVILAQAQVAGGRAGALASTDCIGTATTAFQNYINLFGLSASNPTYTGSATVMAGPVRGLQFQVQAQVSCLFCPFLIGFMPAQLSYNVGTFYPYEDQTACP